MASLFWLPSVDASQRVRLDTDPDSDSAATVTTADGTSVTGALLTADEDGGLPRVMADVDTLYVKRLTYHGDVTGSPIAVVSSDAPPAESPSSPGGSSAVPLNHFAAENNSNLTMNGIVLTTPNDWTVDDVSDYVSLDPDNTTFRFAVEGLYFIQHEVEFRDTNEAGAASDAQVVSWNFARSGGHGNDAAGTGDFSPITPRPPTSGAWIRSAAGSRMVWMTADSTLTLRFAVAGGTGNEVVSYYGVDIFRIL